MGSWTKVLDYAMHCYVTCPNSCCMNEVGRLTFDKETKLDVCSVFIDYLGDKISQT